MPTDLRNLPDDVRRRLAEIDDPAVTIRGDRVVEAVRFRAELRVGNDGSPTVEGYATTYEQGYDVAGGPPFGWTETIARGAADLSLRNRDDVRLLVNHDGITLARTRSNTLHLESDDTGLYVRATLDGKNPTVASLVSAMRRGDMDEMSFAFKATRQEWNADYTERRIEEVKLYDVSVVTYPANAATIAQVRTERPNFAELRKIWPASPADRSATA
jgi:HK97 family phage prohead protease